MRRGMVRASGECHMEQKVAGDNVGMRKGSRRNEEEAIGNTQGTRGRREGHARWLTGGRTTRSNDRRGTVRRGSDGS